MLGAFEKILKGGVPVKGTKQLKVRNSGRFVVLEILTPDFFLQSDPERSLRISFSTNYNHKTKDASCNP